MNPKANGQVKKPRKGKASTNGSANTDATLPPAPHVRVAVVGTGFAGLGMAYRLKQEGIDDFVLLEKADEVGGAWRENTYPGCECDVPSILYSFSFEPNPEWSKSYSPQPEIWQYLRDVARKYGIYPHVRFNHEVLGAEWDDALQRWSITTSQGVMTADFLIGGMGALHDPAIPNLPGIESFEGRTFHSAQWDHDYDLEGKRVAVVGTGASAIQFVPAIQPRVKELHLFQRTPPWIVPRTDRPWTKLEKTLYKRLPLTEKLARLTTYSWLEMRVAGFAINKNLMKIPEAVARAHIARQVSDPELRRKVTPNYEIGCKRILISNDWYPAIAQPNVEVITSGVREVKSNSIVGADGSEREIDAIIWGTGFHVTDMPFAAVVRGRDGRSMAEMWSGTMKSFAGTAVNNFPNFFLIAGPNSGLGHSSMVYMIESNVEHIIRALRFVNDNEAASVEVTEAAVENYDRHVHERLKGTIWDSGGCASWYRDAQGRISTIWPGFTFQFRKINRDFNPAYYTVRDRQGAPMVPVQDTVPAPPVPVAVG